MDFYEVFIPEEDDDPERAEYADMMSRAAYDNMTNSMSLWGNYLSLPQ